MENYKAANNLCCFFIIYILLFMNSPNFCIIVSKNDGEEYL